MKKVFMQIKKSIGMIAMGAAVLAVTLNVISANAKPEGQGLTSHYWYLVDADGFVIQVLGYVTDASVLGLNGCNNTAGRPCAQGFNSDPGLDVDDQIPEDAGNITYTKAP